MSDVKGLNKLRRIVGWSVVGLTAVIGASILLPYLIPRPAQVFYNYHFFPFNFGWLGVILLVFIAFWATRWLLLPWRRGEGYYSYGYPNRDAESILKERYAKGDLTKEQFEQMMLDLKNNT